MCVLSQAFQRREKAKSQHPLAALQRRQANRHTACRAAWMQHQNHPPLPRQSNHASQWRAAQAPVNLVMDTTYFGRKWGVMVLYDACSKRALMVVTVERETNALYTQAVAALREKGVVIQSIICGGKSGLLGSFLDIPVQLCQFHQIKIIVRHLTRKPKSQAAQALRALSLTLTETTQAAFEAALKRWYEQYAAFLNKRSVNEETGHSHYTHKRLRAAYNSLKRHHMDARRGAPIPPNLFSGIGRIIPQPSAALSPLPTLHPRIWLATSPAWRCPPRWHGYGSARRQRRGFAGRRRAGFR